MAIYKPHVFIKRYIIEAQTALCNGSGKDDSLADELILRDHNGFPIILGSSLAGIIKHYMPQNDSETIKFFGSAMNEDDGEGSLITTSPIRMILNNNKVSESFLDFENDSELNELLYRYTNLPMREHVHLDHRGTNLTGSLFDHEVVYKGTRFVFELSLETDEEKDKTYFSKIDEFIHSPLFRLGGKTRNGLGAFKVLKTFSKDFNLLDKKDLKDYLNFKTTLDNINNLEFKATMLDYKTNCTHYALHLAPDNFFIFGGNEITHEADRQFKTEYVVEYNKNNKIEFKEQVLIPATSIKGAISHRVAYYYNLKNKVFSDTKDINFSENVYTKNKAVNAVFGSAKGSVEKKLAHTENQGAWISNDVYLDAPKKSKVFNHVAIDRFTGGAMDGALFSEKVATGCQFTFESFLVKNLEPEYKDALKKALIEITHGMLPLGGMTTKGHGYFNGELEITPKSEPICDK